MLYICTFYASPGKVFDIALKNIYLHTKKSKNKAVFLFCVYDVNMCKNLACCIISPSDYSFGNNARQWWNWHPWRHPVCRIALAAGNDWVAFHKSWSCLWSMMFWEISGKNSQSHIRLSIRKISYIFRKRALTNSENFHLWILTLVS